MSSGEPAAPDRGRSHPAVVPALSLVAALLSSVAGLFYLIG